MSEFTTYPREDLYESTLQSDISSSDTSITVTDAVQFALSSGTCYAHIDYDKPSKYEIVSITALSADKKTWTVTRAVAAAYEGGSATAQSHTSGAKVIITHSWKLFSDIKDVIATKADIAGETFTGLIQFSGTGHAGLQLISLTTAERTALTPANGQIVYDETIGENYQYIAGSWNPVSAGSTQANASETVAGKVELATDAEIDAGTDTGGTGASLVAVPSQLNPNNLGNTKSSLADNDVFTISDSAASNAIKKITAGNLGFTKKSILTAKGSFYAASGADTPVEVTAGQDGSHPIYDSGQTANFSSAQRARYLAIDDTKVDATLDNSENTLLTVSVPGHALGTANIIEVTLHNVNWDKGSSNSGDGILRGKYDGTAFVTVTYDHDNNEDMNYGDVVLYLIGNSSTSSQAGKAQTRVTSVTSNDPAKDSTGALNLIVTFQCPTATGREFSFTGYSVKLIPA